MACPLNKFVSEEKITTEKTSADNTKQILPNLISNLFGDLLKDAKFKILEIHIERKCVDECPAKIEDKEVVVDKSQRVCRVKKSNLFDGFFNKIKHHEEENILTAIHSLLITYQEHILEIKKKALSKQKDKGLTDTEFSAECFFNGHLRKEFTGTSESYYIC